MDRRVTPPKRIISPTWSPPPPCKQALIVLSANNREASFPHYSQTGKTVNSKKNFWNVIVLQEKSQSGVRKLNKEQEK